MKYQGHHNKNYWKKCCGRCKLPKTQCCHGVVCANNNSTEHDQSDVSSTEYVDTAHPLSNLSHNNCTKELTVLSLFYRYAYWVQEKRNGRVHQAACSKGTACQWQSKIWTHHYYYRNKLLLNNKPINSYTSIYFLMFKADLFDVIFSWLLLLCLKCFVCLSEVFESCVNDK